MSLDCQHYLDINIINCKIFCKSGPWNTTRYCQMENGIARALLMSTEFGEL